MGRGWGSTFWTMPVKIIGLQSCLYSLLSLQFLSSLGRKIILFIFSKNMLTYVPHVTFCFASISTLLLYRAAIERWHCIGCLYSSLKSSSFRLKCSIYLVCIRPSTTCSPGYHCEGLEKPGTKIESLH